MSRLRELIEQLCPDGVEYKQLGDVAPIMRESVDVASIGNDEFVGVQEMLQSKLGVQESLPSLPMGGRVHRFQPGDTLIGNIRPYLKKIWHADREGGTSGDVVVVRPTSSVDDRYVFYVLSADAFFEYDMNHSKGSKMPRGDRASIAQYLIPVPPIEVQREIVRILDSMQELDDALSEEIEMRTAQMSIFVKNLLKLDGVSEFTKLGVVCSIKTGKKPDVLTEKANGVFPYVNAGLEPSGWVGKKNADGFCVTIPSRGVGGAGKVGFQDGGFWGGPLCYQIRSTSEQFDTKFIYYYLLSIEDELQKLRKTGGMAAVNKGDLAEVRIPVVSKGMQLTIVEKVETLRMLLTSGDASINTELKARRKQFEYYRDRLLDFPEKVA